MAKNLMFSKSYYLLAPDIQTRIRLTRLKCVLIKLWWAISSCCRQLHVYECKMCERTSWPQSETGHFTCVVLHMFSALLPRRSVDLNENQTENSSEIGNSIKSTEGEKVTSLSPFDICRYFHIKLYTAIICNYFLDPMYLLYVAIICIVPALVLPVADVSSIVPKHCITRVHDHCVQGVPALILEEKQINNQSIHKQKMQYSRKKRIQTYLCKVFGEHILETLGEIKGFWERNPAVKFVCGTAAVPKSLQVHAQDTRQWEEFDTLNKTNEWMWVHDYAGKYVSPTHSRPLIPLSPLNTFFFPQRYFY